MSQETCNFCGANATNYSGNVKTCGRCSKLMREAHGTSLDKTDPGSQLCLWPGEALEKGF